MIAKLGKIYTNTCDSILQAIQKHKFINILDNPGSADLSTYVDFAAVRHSAEEVSGLVILICWHFLLKIFVFVNG